MRFMETIRRRRGFTLVEMLVVIGIIAILAALLIPVVQGALANAQKTRNAQELAQIMMAIERYKSENGGQYPPSFGEVSTDNPGPNGETTYDALFGADNTDLSGKGAYRNTILYRYLITAFPRISNQDIRYVFKHVADRQNQSTAIVFWLSQTANDPRNPFTNQPGFRKYFEFDSTRLTELSVVPSVQIANNTNSTQLQLFGYRPPYAKESYVAYMEAKHYPYYMNRNVNLDEPVASDGSGGQGTNSPARAGPILNNYALRPYLKLGGDKFRTNLKNYLNPESYQLHCAGLDGVHQTQLSLSYVRYFPCGDQGLTWGNQTIPADKFSFDRDNQTNFSEGRCIQDVQPN